MHVQGRSTTLAKLGTSSTLWLLLSLGAAHAQVEDQLEYNFLGAGARANGMGDAFIAVADDATAIFWNPAGLLLLDQPEASFGFQFFSENVDRDRSTDTFLLVADEPPGSADLNFASFVYPRRFGQEKFVFAFAVQKALDFRSEFLELPARVPLVLNQDKSRGGPFSYSGGIAFSPMPGLLLGSSVSFYRGRAELAGNQILALDDELLVSLSGSSRIRVNGTSFGVGALWDFRSRGGLPLRLGFKIVPGFDFSGAIDTDVSFRIVDSQGVAHDETTPVTYDYALDFPLDLGTGFAWTPRRNLLIAADFEHRRLRNSALRVFENPDVIIDGEGNVRIRQRDTINTLSDSGADLDQWRVGFEWSWVNNLTVIPIRAGVKNLPQVGAHERGIIDPASGQVTTFFEDQVVGTAITSGVGIVDESFVFDLSMEYGGWTKDIVLIDGEGTQSRKLETRQLSLKVSFVLYF